MKTAVVSGVLATVIGGIILSFVQSRFGEKENQDSVSISSIESGRDVVVGDNSTINNISISNALRTEIIEDIPDVPELSKDGRCFGSSSVLRKPTAWRCTSDNVIYDPCIEILDPFNRGMPKIVCKSSPNFRMELLAPLPTPSESQFSPDGNEVEKFETFDGEVCTFLTGATMSHYDRLNYTCETKESGQEMLIMGFPVPGEVWTAKAVFRSEDGDNVRNRVVRIKTVWR